MLHSAYRGKPSVILGLCATWHDLGTQDQMALPGAGVTRMSSVSTWLIRGMWQLLGVPTISGCQEAGTRQLISWVHVSRHSANYMSSMRRHSAYYKPSILPPTIGLPQDTWQPLGASGRSGCRHESTRQTISRVAAQDIRLILRCHVALPLTHLAVKGLLFTSTLI